MAFRSGQHTKNPRETVINLLQAISGSEWWSIDTGLQVGTGTTVLGWTGSVGGYILTDAGLANKCSYVGPYVISNGVNSGLIGATNILSGSKEYTLILGGTLGTESVAGLDILWQYGSSAIRCGGYVAAGTRNISSYWFNTVTDSEWSLTNYTAPDGPAIYAFRASSNVIPSGKKIQRNAIEPAQTQPAETSNGSTVMPAGSLTYGYDGLGLGLGSTVISGSDLIVCPKMMSQDQINVITTALRRIRNI